MPSSSGGGVDCECENKERGVGCCVRPPTGSSRNVHVCTACGAFLWCQQQGIDKSDGEMVDSRAIVHTAGPWPQGPPLRGRSDAPGRNTPCLRLAAGRRRAQLERRRRDEVGRVGRRLLARLDRLGVDRDGPDRQAVGRLEQPQRRGEVARGDGLQLAEEGRLFCDDVRVVSCVMGVCCMLFCSGGSAS